MSTLTFGVELEFIVFYFIEDHHILPHDLHETIHGPPVLVSRNLPIAEGWEGKEKELHGCWLRQKVADVIKSTGAKVQAECTHTDQYNGWGVTKDCSLRLPLHIEQEYLPYEYAGIEIQSPALTANEESFKQVKRVVEAIRTSFRAATPPVCGLHVHVGVNRTTVSLRDLQRIACMTWAAEGLIDALHPGCRLGNRQCLGSRHYSNLARRMDAEQATLGHTRGQMRGPAHDEPCVERINSYKAKPTILQYNKPTGITADVDSTPSRSLAADCEVRLTNPNKEILPGSRGIMDGCRQILRTTEPEAVAELMALPLSRGAYNFKNCSYESTEPAHGKRTVEFRQAAGSLDEDWVVLWARICLALCGSAVQATDEEFFQLLYDCVLSDFSEERYNVFDFLYDIGMEDDVERIHTRIRDQRHEREPTEQLCVVSAMTGALTPTSGWTNASTMLSTTSWTTSSTAFSTDHWDDEPIPVWDTHISNYDVTTSTRGVDELTWDDFPDIMADGATTRMTYSTPREDGQTRQRLLHEKGTHFDGGVPDRTVGSHGAGRGNVG
ncbi:Uu.00g143100.m01.CDS01 [Anthostomella pinea]|uniref:Uu.00g143100.m01.CDS01 n=1 Tax=Anthostomella pinea TaxID=933095 RepID=A0AAI8VRE8_9PEZI|nr:Uu.00g143100.m01.CDS01 [Anthostomella pinea]